MANKTITRLTVVLVLLFGMHPAMAVGPLRILLTNDDGYQSPGIQALHEALSAAGHDVYLIAPATQQSGASASITSSGVKVEKKADRVWAVTGRPADAVRVGIGHIMDEKPDLIVSGINFGQNVGQDVGVSGTVGAAITALRMGYPAIAISAEIKFSEMAERFPSTQKAFPDAAQVLVSTIKEIRTLSTEAMININYPALPLKDIAGYEIAEIADYSIFVESYRTNGAGMLVPNFNTSSPTQRNGDALLLSQGYVTYTLLDGDMSVRANRKLKKVVRALD